MAISERKMYSIKTYFYILWKEMQTFPKKTFSTTFNKLRLCDASVASCLDLKATYSYVGMWIVHSFSVGYVIYLFVRRYNEILNTSRGYSCRGDNKNDLKYNGKEKERKRKMLDRIKPVAITI